MKVDVPTMVRARHAEYDKTASKPLLEAALSYAKRGWLVLPLHTPTRDGCSCLSGDCKSVGKHPRIANGCKGASSSAEQIRSWWTRWPDANIGIATGPRSRLFVLDIDGNEGQASLRALEAQQRLPKTLSVLTGRRGADGKREGYHLYFDWPAGARLRNSVPRGIGKGLDARGDGCYVVAPPSVHASGLHYEWASAESAVADSPSWLVAAYSTSPPISSSPPRVSLFYVGHRNQELFRLGRKWHREGGIERAELERKLLTANIRRCRPPLDEPEVLKIAANAVTLQSLGPDALETAWRLVEAEEHSSGYNQLVALARHLEASNSGCAILLPVERIAKLIGCDRTMVGRYRRKAVAERVIEEVGRYIAQRTATQFRVLPTL